MKQAAREYPIALSRLGGEADSINSQTARAIIWLRKQPGGSIVVVTPQKGMVNEVVERFIRTSGATHLSWKGLSSGSFSGHRVLHVAPDRKRLDHLWGAEMDALAVTEWSDLSEWAEDVQADVLSIGDVKKPASPVDSGPDPALPEDIASILAGLAAWAAGYDSG